MNEKDYLSCMGISSIVNPIKKTHVTFLDVEDKNKEFRNNKSLYSTLIDYLNDYFNYYIVFKSSKDGYHVINPVVRPKTEVFQLKSQIPFDDAMHNSIGFKRNSWVLRISEKGDKPKPEVIRCKFNHKHNEKDINKHTYSYSHLKYLYDIYPKIRKPIKSVINNIGYENMVKQKLRVEKYFTY